MAKHYMYVVLCQDQSLYTGYSTDVSRRLAQHNAGKGAKYTRSRRPVRLLYTESFPNQRSAMQAEYAFKQKTRAQKLRYIQEHMKQQ